MHIAVQCFYTLKIIFLEEDSPNCINFRTLKCESAPVLGPFPVVALSRPHISLCFLFFSQ